MDNLPFYRTFYEQADIRNEVVSSEERIPMTLEMIPPDINSCLDLGCGDGTILDKIDSNLLKVGADYSSNVLKSVNFKKKVISLSSAIPFHSNAYDLIICTEVLEHLRSEEFKLTVKDLQRVAKKYILISVPFQEDLKRKQTRCPECGYIYHIHLHFKNFNHVKLNSLFTKFSPKSYRLSNTLEKSYPNWLLKFRRKYAHRWEWCQNALCPRCGFKNSNPPPRTTASIITSLLASISGKNHPKWIVVLYEKI